MVAWFLCVYLLYYSYIYAKVHQQLTAMQTENLEAEKKQPPFDFTPNI
jgi:hypothetical protein